MENPHLQCLKDEKNITDLFNIPNRTRISPVALQCAGFKKNGNNVVGRCEQKTCVLLCRKCRAYLDCYRDEEALLAETYYALSKMEEAHALQKLSTAHAFIKQKWGLAYDALHTESIGDGMAACDEVIAQRAEQNIQGIQQTLGRRAHLTQTLQNVELLGNELTSSLTISGTTSPATPQSSQRFALPMSRGSLSGGRERQQSTTSTEMQELKAEVKEIHNKVDEIRGVEPSQNTTFKIFCLQGVVLMGGGRMCADLVLQLINHAET